MYISHASKSKWPLGRFAIRWKGWNHAVGFGYEAVRSPFFGIIYQMKSQTIQLLQGIYSPQFHKDCRAWTALGLRSFNIRAFYSRLIMKLWGNCDVSHVCSTRPPLKMITFSWVALKDLSSDGPLAKQGENYHQWMSSFSVKKKKRAC